MGVNNVWDIYYKQYSLDKKKKKKWIHVRKGIRGHERMHWWRWHVSTRRPEKKECQKEWSGLKNRVSFSFLFSFSFWYFLIVESYAVRHPFSNEQCASSPFESSNSVKLMPNLFGRHLNHATFYDALCAGIKKQYLALMCSAIKRKKGKEEEEEEDDMNFFLQTPSTWN